jgi:L-methionine (R)-S-oxide reductase
LAVTTDDFLDSISRALTAPEGVREALRLTLVHFGAESGTIHLLGADGLLHLEVASEGIPSFVLDLVRTVPIGKGMAGLAVERAEPVQTCNLQTDTTGDVRPGARATGLRGAVAVPIFDGERAVGALGIGNQAERTFSDEESRLLIAVGRRIAALAS